MGASVPSRLKPAFEAASVNLRTMLRLIRSAATSATLVCILTTAAPAGASVVIALDLQELTAEADRIVVGEVAWAEPIRTGNGLIRTRYRIQVERDLRGSGDREILVETLGGQVGSIAMRVEGAPSFSLGERVLVFVQGEDNAIFRPVGMAQGVLRIQRENGRDMVAPSPSDILLVRPDGTGVLRKSAGPLSATEPLDAFLSRVHEIIEAQRGDAL